MQDEKYVVFKREDLFMMLGGFLPTGDVDCAPIAQEMEAAVEKNRLQDAVVIRRQDVFAGPALHAYAACISVAARLAQEDQGSLLQGVADYFHTQAVLADEEGYKIPD